MPGFRLFTISPFGKCTVILSDYEYEVLIAAGEKLIEKNPGIQFGIADEYGYFVWPEALKNTRKGKQEGLLLPPSCSECPVENCRLPYSKVLPNRRLANYAYKRHPKCNLEVTVKNQYLELIGQASNKEGALH